MQANRINTYLVRDLLTAFQKKFLSINNVNEITDASIKRVLDDPNALKGITMNADFIHELKQGLHDLDPLTKRIRAEFVEQTSANRLQAVNKIQGEKNYDIANPVIRLELNGVENVRLEKATEGVEINEYPGFLDITINPGKFKDSLKLNFIGEYKGEKVDFVVSAKGYFQGLRGTFDSSNTATVTLPPYIEIADKELLVLGKPSSEITLKVTKEANGKELKFQSDKKIIESIATNNCMLTVNGRPVLSHFILEPAPAAQPAESRGFFKRLFGIS